LFHRSSALTQAGCDLYWGPINHERRWSSVLSQALSPRWGRPLGRLDAVLTNLARGALAPGSASCNSWSAAGALPAALLLSPGQKSCFRIVSPAPSRTACRRCRI